MAFALFYNGADLAAVDAALQRSDLTLADSVLALKIRVAGLASWLTAPVTVREQADGDPDCRLIVIGDLTVSASAMIALLNRIAALPGGEFMAAIAADMGCRVAANCHGCRDPWV